MTKRSNLGYAVAITTLLGVSFGAGCGEESSVGSSDGALRGGVRPEHAGAAGEGDEGSDESAETDEGDESAVPGDGWVPGDDVPEDFCVQGGMVSRIEVAFDCDDLVIISCKDLSNVVLEFEDGTRQKFDGLSGQSASFSGTGANAGKVVVGVWVKAGANFSGDGPGYGERFDGPSEYACEDGGDGDGDGDGDDACDDLDEDCGGPPPGDGDGDGDSGDGDGDGDDGECDNLDEDCGGDPPPTDTVNCVFEPDSPLCHVD
jgi:hypothetical protein